MEYLIFILWLLPFFVIPILTPRNGEKGIIAPIILIAFATIYSITYTIYAKFPGDPSDKEVLQSAQEYAYAEGQIDYITGDRIAVELTITENDTIYKWIESPWDNDMKPIYNFELK